MAKASQNGELPKEGGEPERRLSALDRAVLAAIGEQRTVGRADDPAAEAYPDVWQWLTKTEGGRDYIMQPAVITIQLGPEGVIATLTLRDLGRSCSVACEHIKDVLPTLQAALTSPVPPIKSWGKSEPHLKKRRQRP